MKKIGLICITTMACLSLLAACGNSRSNKTNKKATSSSKVVKKHHKKSSTKKKATKASSTSSNYEHCQQPSVKQQKDVSISENSDSKLSGGAVLKFYDHYNQKTGETHAGGVLVDYGDGQQSQAESTAQSMADNNQNGEVSIR